MMTTTMTKKSFKQLLAEFNGKIPPEVQDQITMKEIIHYLNSEIIANDEVKCPCCRSHVQIYKRTISRAQVCFLFALRRMTKDGTKYILFNEPKTLVYERLKLNASDYTYLKFWGLIVPFLKFDPKRNKDVSTGEYTITSKGMDWLDGKIEIPKYRYFAKLKEIKVSTETMKASDANNFDYNDLTILQK